MASLLTASTEAEETPLGAHTPLSTSKAHSYRPRVDQDPEPPLLWIQNPANKLDVLSCAFCGRAELRDQLVHLSKRSDIMKDSTKRRIKLPSMVESSRCECELGCGISYCGPACRVKDAACGHAQLCVGPHDDNHPLYRYVVLSMESGDAYTEFMMAARMSVLACLGSGHQSKTTFSSTAAGSTPDIDLRVAQATAFWTNTVNDMSVPFWWKLVSPEISDFEAENYIEAAENLVKEAWQLLTQGVVLKGSQAFYSKFHYKHFGRVLTFISREKMNLSVPSSLQTHILSMSSTPEEDWDKNEVTTYVSLAQSIAHEQLERCLTNIEEEEDEAGQSDSELSDEDRNLDRSILVKQCDSASSSKKESVVRELCVDPTCLDAHCPRSTGPEYHDVRRLRNFLSADQRKAMRMIIAQPSLYLTPPLVLVCVPSTSTIGLPHSCIPTHKVEALLIDNPSQGHTKTKCRVESQSQSEGSLAVRLLPTGKQQSSRGGRVDSLLFNTSSVSKIGDVGAMDLMERNEMLSLAGISCECKRCQFEAEAGSKKDLLDSYSTQVLASLALAAQNQERYSDARYLWKLTISSTTSDTAEYADALYNHARLVGWCDDWSSAHRLMVEAGKLAPKHGEIGSWLKGSESYAVLADPSTSNYNFGSSNLKGIIEGRAFVQRGVFTSEECATIVGDVEEHVAMSSSGWTTSRHYAVPTTDIPIHEVPSVLARFNEALVERIYPLLAEQFQVAAANLRVIDAFVVKYSAESQRSLPLHCDQSQFSLTITLNSSDEYEGGGTYFADAGEVVNCEECGAVISFDGSLLHGGHPITCGTRYIIVVFLYEYLGVDKEAEEKQAEFLSKRF